MTDKHTPGPWRTIGNETIMAIHRYESELIAAGERMLDAEYGPERIAARQARLAELAAQTEKDRAMTHPIEDMLNGQFTDGITKVYRAALAEGVKIGERDMRLKLYPLIRELIDALDDYVPDDGPDRDDAEELIGRAGEILSDTAPETAASEAAE